MMRAKGILAVSFLAMLAVGPAMAEIASKGYVDEKLETKADASALSGYAKTTELSAVSGRVTTAQSTADAAQEAAENAQATANAKVTANAGITGATHTKITYDSKGLVTAGTDLTANDIPTIPSSKVSGLGTLATKSSVGTNDIANGAVTSAKLGEDVQTALEQAGSAVQPGNMPVATGSAVGGVKSAGDITVATDGAVTVNSATNADHATRADSATNATNADHADTADTATNATNATNATKATKATQDADGNVITDTYATKTELGAKADTADLAKVATTGSYNDLTNKPTIPTVNNATLTIQRNGTQVDTFTANASANKTINITVPTKTSELSNDSNFATTTQVNARVATAQGSGNANKAVVTNASGNITTGTIASGMIADGAVTSAKIADGTITANDIANGTITSGKLATAVQTALTSAGTAVQPDDLAEVATTGSYNDLADKPTIPTQITVDSALSSTSTNPVQNKVINTALAGKLSTSGTAARATADASGNNIANTYATKSQITALDSSSSGTGAVVTAVSQTDGKVSVTKGNVKIPVGGENATSYATIWVQ